MYIEELTIYTRDVAAQDAFYGDRLGLSVESAAAGQLTLRFGRSTLHLLQRPDATPYHFALNIPANQVAEALEWLKGRVGVLKDGEREIQDFSAWNAEAMYCYDADRNIVELIARKSLDNAATGPFDASHLLEISEIGLPTTDIRRVYTKLRDRTGIDVYDGSFDRFCAIGDDHGLIICIDQNKKDWFPTNDRAYPSDFLLDMTQGGNRYRLTYRRSSLTVEPLG